MGKSWDTKKVNDFIESFEHATRNYITCLDDVHRSYEAYTNNETFVGQAADSTKNFFNIKQKEFNRQQYELSREMVRRYVDLDETFKAIVDPASDAKIDTDVVGKVKVYFMDQYDNLEHIGCNIQQKTIEAVDRLGKYGCGLEDINFKNTIMQYYDYCGNGGFLDSCIKKVEEFDDTASTRVFNSGIKNAIQEHIEEISDKAAGLDMIRTQVVGVDKQVLSLTALSSMTGIIKGIGKFFVAGAEGGSISELYSHKKTRAIEQYENEKNPSGKEPAMNLMQMQAYGKGKNLHDYTKEIDAWLVEQERYFDNLYKSYPTYGERKFYFTFLFVEKVKTGGDMDIKQRGSWQNAFPNIKYPPDTGESYFIYHGQVMDPATLGNVVYAYVGAKYYSDEMLRFGGGAVQTKRRDITDLPVIFSIPDYGEMPEDIEAINLGIEWAKEGFPDG